MKEILKELNFIYALAEHCNLNCAGCDHFSPIAEPQFADYEEFCRDFKRLSEIFKGKCRRIGLMGGEPLLNPDIEKYLYIARDTFPNAQISIVTNGLLLGNMGEKFFDACIVNSIEIEYTKYPIDFDYESIHKDIEKKGILISAYGNTGTVQKTLYSAPLAIDGKESIEWNFENCFHANNCIQLKHGRIYTCTIIPNVEHFNKRFGKKIPIDEEDGLNIYKSDLMEDDVYRFLVSPKNFCKYCDVKNRIENIPWNISCKSMEEWVYRDGV